MPHTTTKSHRSKRPDFRPNEKVRRKLQKQVEDSKKIQNLRITSVQKHEKKERIAQVTPLTTLSKDEKVLRALRKKLNAINDLLETERQGIDLDAQQQQKVATLKSVMDEMEDIMNRSVRRRGSDDSGEEDDESV